MKKGRCRGLTTCQEERRPNSKGRELRETFANKGTKVTARTRARTCLAQGGRAVRGLFFSCSQEVRLTKSRKRCKVWFHTLELQMEILAHLVMSRTESFVMCMMNEVDCAPRPQRKDDDVMRRDDEIASHALKSSVLGLDWTWI